MVAAEPFDRTNTTQDLYPDLRGLFNGKEDAFEGCLNT